MNALCQKGYVDLPLEMSIKKYLKLVVHALQEDPRLTYECLNDGSEVFRMAEPVQKKATASPGRSYIDFVRSEAHNFISHMERIYHVTPTRPYYVNNITSTVKSPRFTMPEAWKNADKDKLVGDIVRVMKLDERVCFERGHGSRNSSSDSFFWKGMSGVPTLAISDNNSSDPSSFDGLVAHCTNYALEWLFQKNNLKPYHANNILQAIQKTDFASSPDLKLLDKYVLYGRVVNAMKEDGRLLCEERYNGYNTVVFWMNNCKLSGKEFVALSPQPSPAAPVFFAASTVADTSVVDSSAASSAASQFQEASSDPSEMSQSHEAASLSDLHLNSRAAGLLAATHVSNSISSAAPSPSFDLRMAGLHSSASEQMLPSESEDAACDFIATSCFDNLFGSEELSTDGLGIKGFGLGRLAGGPADAITTAQTTVMDILTGNKSSTISSNSAGIHTVAGVVGTGHPRRHRPSIDFVEPAAGSYYSSNSSSIAGDFVTGSYADCASDGAAPFKHLAEQSVPGREPASPTGSCDSDACVLRLSCTDPKYVDMLEREAVTFTDIAISYLTLHNNAKPFLLNNIRSTIMAKIKYVVPREVAQHGVSLEEFIADVFEFMSSDERLHYEHHRELTKQAFYLSVGGGGGDVTLRAPPPSAPDVTSSAASRADKSSSKADAHTKAVVSSGSGQKAGDGSGHSAAVPSSGKLYHNLSELIEYFALTAVNYLKIHRNAKPFHAHRIKAETGRPSFVAPRDCRNFDVITLATNIIEALQCDDRLVFTTAGKDNTAVLFWLPQPAGNNDAAHSGAMVVPGAANSLANDRFLSQIVANFSATAIEWLTARKNTKPYHANLIRISIGKQSFAIPKSCAIRDKSQLYAAVVEKMSHDHRLLAKTTAGGAAVFWLNDGSNGNGGSDTPSDDSSNSTPQPLENDYDYCQVSDATPDGTSVFGSVGRPRTSSEEFYDAEYASFLQGVDLGGAAEETARSAASAKATGKKVKLYSDYCEETQQPCASSAKVVSTVVTTTTTGANDKATSRSRTTTVTTIAPLETVATSAVGAVASAGESKNYDQHAPFDRKIATMQFKTLKEATEFIITKALEHITRTGKVYFVAYLTNTINHATFVLPPAYAALSNNVTRNKARFCTDVINTMKRDTKRLLYGKTGSTEFFTVKTK